MVEVFVYPPSEPSSRGTEVQDKGVIHNLHGENFLRNVTFTPCELHSENKLTENFAT
jgi:hypothetical protein